MQFIRKLLCKFLPKRVKRMFFLSTLGFVFSKVQSQEEEKYLIKRLNVELNMADEEGAIRYAIRFADVVWKHIHTTEEEGRTHYYVRDLFLHLPAWMEYDEEVHMMEDLVQLANVVSDHLKQPVIVSW